MLIYKKKFSKRYLLNIEALIVPDSTRNFESRHAYECIALFSKINE